MSEPVAIMTPQLSAPPSRAPRLFLYFCTTVAAFLLGIALTYVFHRVLYTGPRAVSFFLIPASLTADLAILSALFYLLPTPSGPRMKAPLLLAWLLSSLLGFAVFLGMAAAPIHAEPLRVFLVLALLCASQCAVIAAAYGLLGILLGPTPVLSRQMLLLMLAVLTTALVWSRGIILAAEYSSPVAGPHRAEVLIDGAMAFSPPLAVSACWYNESDAGVHQRGNRFEITHSGPITYDTWIGGKGNLTPYPQLLPPKRNSDEGSINPGLCLAMLGWGIPVMALCEILRRKRSTRMF